MNKEDIINKLNESNLDKNEIIIISGASLVVHGIIDSTSDIDLVCSKSYYDSLNWNVKKGFFDVDIKYKDVFEISNNLYDEFNKYDIIDEYKFLNLEECLKLKLKTNREKDQNVIKKLKEILK